MSSRILLGATLLAALLAGCSSVPLENKAGADASAASDAAKAGAGANQSARPVAQVVAPSVDPLDDPKGKLAERSVFFGFDSYVVEDKYRPVVEAHGRYLATRKDRNILIQGNTDERGSREYNLALGQKRAEAVRKSLALLGVPESQMEAVSLGEEKPRGTGHDEASWAQNRRGDIVYR